MQRTALILHFGVVCLFSLPRARTLQPPLKLKQMAARMESGDRLILYVTAHGKEARGLSKYNTTISCCNDQPISARQLEAWLEEDVR